MPTLLASRKLIESKKDLNLKLEKSLTLYFNNKSFG